MTDAKKSSTESAKLDKRLTEVVIYHAYVLITTSIKATPTDAYVAVRFSWLRLSPFWFFGEDDLDGMGAFDLNLPFMTVTHLDREKNLKSQDSVKPLYF